MTLPRRHVVSALGSKGFKSKKGGDHAWYFYYRIDGVKSNIKTKVSRSPKFKTLGADLIAKMSRQCKLPSSRDFRRLVDCSMDQAEYEEAVQEHL